MMFTTDERGLITSVIRPQPGTEDLYTGYHYGEVPVAATHYRNGDFLTQPAQPTLSHVWSDETFSWSIDLALFKQNTIATLKSDFESTMYLPVLLEQGLIDADKVSIENLNGAKSELVMGVVPEHLIWKMANNSVVVFDTVDAYSTFIDTAILACIASRRNDYFTYWAKKNAVANATTYEEVLLSI